MPHDFTQWWKEWWAEDYSWDGLAQKPWAGWCVLPDGQVAEDPSSWPEGHAEHGPQPDGARPETLQDYWRDQEGALIESPVSGKRFTIIHLPLEWEDGSPTPEVEQLAVPHAKYRVSNVTKTDEEGNVIGADRRLIIDGAVLPIWKLRDLDTKESPWSSRGQVPICARRCFFAGTACFRRPISIGELSIKSSVFSGDVYFSSVAFSENAIFDDVIVSRNVRFDEASFIKNVSFVCSVFWICLVQ